MEPVILTDQDIENLNKAAIERSAAIARIGGGVLVAVGLIGAVAWLWIFGRQQAEADSLSFVLGNSDSESPGVADRLDLATSSIGVLLSACLVAGLGLLLRSVGDYFQARIGGSVTGSAAGDQLKDTDDPDIGLVP